MTQNDVVIHLVGGGVAGTVGAIVTCPLEVVKTRLQSSQYGMTAEDKEKVPKSSSCKICHAPSKNMFSNQRRRLSISTLPRSPAHVVAISSCGVAAREPMGLIQCLRHIIETEGARALFKGLGPNLIGVAPSRAIYFSAYQHSKKIFNSLLTPDTPIVHVCSASSAGFFASTLTNPIWFVKTRLQLDYRKHGQRMTALECVKRIYSQNGFFGFYKGITASYFGISETVIHFVIYEEIKAKLLEIRTRHPDDTKSSRDFVEFMMAGACSKTIASILTYPHEVARTRLREEGNKYCSFCQTLTTVYSEEGYRGLYRGLTTQLIRQIPNTAIIMATYEAVVYTLTKYGQSGFYQSTTT